MSDFSYRWGLPLCRDENNQKRNCRGRRPGGAVPCRSRLLGWIKNVARRSTTWGDVDLATFCSKTGYSREHATRELSKIRRDYPELVFETKLRCKRSGKPAIWGVIVCEAKKLKFDRCSLFYGRDGKALRNYTTLGDGGEKLVPPDYSRRSFGSYSEQPIEQPNSEGLCDNSYKKEDSYGIQQKELYGARRFVELSPNESPPSPPIDRRERLKKKASSLLAKLKACHYDNCKVTFCRRTGYRYAFGALMDGHDQEQIIRCYEKAMLVCHAFAVDRGAHEGRVVFFNPASTVSKARQSLASDGLNRKERMRKWYLANSVRKPVSEIASMNIDEIRAKILATFPR